MSGGIVWGWVLRGAALVALLGPARAGAETVLLSWTAPGDDGDVGRAASYELRYAQSSPAGSDTAAWWSAATTAGPLPAPQTAGTREYFLVSGLQPSRTYYFVIRSSDEVPNVSGFSNVAVKQTAGSAALATPGQFKASLAPGAVLLSWEVVNPNSELGYRLYRKGSGDVSAALLATLSLVTTEWTDSTVLGSTAYEYQLVTYSDSLESVPAVVGVTIPADRLLAPSEVLHGYPNPARDHVTIRFTVDSAAANGPTRITIFDLAGHKIHQLADQVMTPGEHAIEWSCRSEQGSKLAPGLYNVILDGPSGRGVTRLVIVP